MGPERLVVRLRLLLRPGGRGVGEHPTPETLAAYEADELTPEENESIQEHFLRCRECPEMLLDLKDFTAAGPEASRELPESWVASAWQSLRARLVGERSPAPPPGLGTKGWRRWHASLRGAHALCAVLLAVSVALGGWVARLTGEVRRLSEPQINVPVETLGTGTRGETAIHLIEVPEEAERVLLILVAPAAAAPDAHGAFRLEIETAKGKPKWAGDVPSRSDGTLVVDLPRRFLSAGDYLLRVRGVDRQGREHSVDHAVRVAYATRSNSIPE